MPLTNAAFVASEGSYYAHVFENHFAGVPRALYWSFTVSFEGIHYLGTTWKSSLTIEWVTLGIREFTGVHSLSSTASPGAEASLYLAEHHPIEDWRGRISWNRSHPQCILDFDVTLDFPGLDHDPVAGLHLTGRSALNFDGFIIVPDNLSPQPTSVAEAGTLLRQYFHTPCVAVDEDWRYVFRPINREAIHQ